MEQAKHYDSISQILYLICLFSVAPLLQVSNSLSLSVARWMRLPYYYRSYSSSPKMSDSSIERDQAYPYLFEHHQLLQSPIFFYTLGFIIPLTLIEEPLKVRGTFYAILVCDPLCLIFPLGELISCYCLFAECSRVIVLLCPGL